MGLFEGQVVFEGQSWEERRRQFDWLGLGGGGRDVIFLQFGSFSDISFSPQNSNLMRRQPMLQSLGRVYRQFSRQRYNKYRSQFPRMREADIVLKIIKEWERMDSEERQGLKNWYISHKFIRDEEEAGSSSGAMKTPQSKNMRMRNELLMNSQKSMLVPTTAKYTPLFEMQPDSSQFRRHSGPVSSSSKSETYSAHVQSQNGDSSSKTRPKHQEYIHFYKHFYRKLSGQHPRWTAAKISQLIKLLWRRQQKTKDRSLMKKGKERKFKHIKRVSGWLRFKMSQKRMGMEEGARMKWKRLPAETKKMYDVLGRENVIDRVDLRKRNVVIRLGSRAVCPPQLEYLYMF